MFIVSDLLSLLPSSDSNVAPRPTVGSPAPKDPNDRLNFPLDPPRPIALVFVRHCGCPFAEDTVHTLLHKVLDDPERYTLASGSKLQFLIVTHAPLTESREWFASVLHAAYESYKPAEGKTKPDSDVIQQHFSLFPQGPSQSLSKAYGLGSLPSYSTMFSKGMWAEFSKLKERGIVNRATASGSDRWAAHGGCVVDQNGTVKWIWIADKIEEFGDWEAAVSSLGI
ncbi:hypothetical protein [Phaffia rhodozyma]|uniref:Thioredoxin-like fold n=1 Tax=Phaffia rhodozyma TaxID=264483 RepID=A0A0F7SXF3_PHARH|nr:hypothetical protein [Phaffia rhodozyma]